MMSQTSTFSSCMHDQMLESNKDDVKLEAMRCVTVMTAKGKLTVPRTLFPHIVKNVSSKNPELKKLIYLYLTNFADQEPDLALLPVATLQKSLKSPNPLIRSSALKVLTSIRLNILTAILMASLRNSVNDLSPYVRKTVAHSIIKIHRLDPSLREELVEYIERLFNDKNSMVLSSAVATFEVVCPEKLELVHKNYRRFCFILADCNEWGQTVLLNLLMRYVIETYGKAKEPIIQDYNPSEHDPKILLRSSKPLVHSNNSAVVMAVIKLYIAVANFNEIRSTITRPLVRLLYSKREIQLIVLKMIDELTNLDNEILTNGNSTELDQEDTEEDELQHANPVKDTTKDMEKQAVTVQVIEQEVKQVQDEKQENQDVEIKKDGYQVIGDENEENGCKIDVKERIEDGQQRVQEVEKEDEQEDPDGDHEEVSEDDEEEESDEEEDDEEEDEDDDEDGDEDEEDEEEDDDEEEEEEDEDKIEKDDTEERIQNNRAVFDSSLIDFNPNKDPGAFREVFRPYIKSFFVKHTDCTQIRLAKLKILTNLSSSVNVTIVLRELQAYIAAYVEDKEFVSAAIHAIGRCAMIVKEVAHTCLNGLTSLLSNNNEHIVSEAIVVLRSQIINKKPTEGLKESSKKELINGNNNDNHETEKSKLNENHKTVDDDDDESISDNVKIVSTVIKQVTKLLPTVTAPQARATILWILAEFCDKNLTAAKCAPEVLRSIAKSFCQEDNFVKLQSLTLATKFLLSLDKEQKAELYHKVFLLTGYLFNLAKYDINHDIRDRGRFLMKLLEEEEICCKVLNFTPIVA